MRLTCTRGSSTRGTSSIDTIQMRTHYNRLRALSRNRRNDTALRPRMRVGLRTGNRSRRDVTLYLGQQPGRSLLPCRRAIVPVVIVAERLQVRANVGAAELCIEGLDGCALRQGAGVGDCLSLLELAGGGGEVGPVGYVEEVCSGLCY